MSISITRGHKNESEMLFSTRMQSHTYEILDRVEKDHWWFKGRREILAEFVEGIFFNSGGPMRILDVGCGTGGNLQMLGDFGDAVGVDSSPEAIQYCKTKGLNVVEDAAETLPFSNNEFDLVTGLDVVEHLEDDVAGLKEMYRVTKPGGSVLLFVPAFMWLWGVQDDVSEHKIRYSKSQIVERVNKAGFHVERATFANFTFFTPILIGRTLMRLTGFEPASENNINISALNGFFGAVFGSERHLLKRFDSPIGVSLVVIGRKISDN